MSKRSAIQRTVQHLGLGILALLLPAWAGAACSIWSDRVFLNEYYFGPTTTNFLELYSSDKAFPTSWSGFSVDVYSSLNTKQSYVFDENTATACPKGSKTWVTLDVSGGLVSQDALVILRDPAGNPVDALVFDNSSPPAPWSSILSNYYPGLSTECPALATSLSLQALASLLVPSQDNMLIVSNYGNKDMARFPDGTGVWNISSNRGSGTTYTRCAANNSVLSKTVDKSTAVAGEVVTFTIAVSNGDKHELTGVVVRDDVPAGLANITASVTSGSLTINGQTVTWNVGGVPSGNTATLTIQATIPVTALLGTVYTNNVTSTAGLTPGQSDSASVTVVAAGGLDHLRILHDGQGLTCAPEVVTVQACANADCSQTYSAGVNGTLGWTGGASGSAPFSIPSGQSQVDVALRVTSPVTVGLGASAGSPPSAHVTRCFIGTGENCQMAFADTGFIFDVPTLTACKPSLPVSLRAVKKSDSGMSCAPAFQGSRTLRFWSTYVDPASGGQTVAINGTNVAVLSPGTPINLSFDATGTANFTATYPDAGQMLLDVRYDGSAATGDAGLVMTGSDLFVSRPVGLAVYSEDAQSACSPASANCTVFKKAGETFPLKVKAACWTADGDPDLSDNPATPNFRLGGITMSHHVVAPALGLPGTLGVTTFDMLAADEGVKTLMQSVSEVGVFSFTATPPNYLGETIPPVSSANIGRFIPHHFALAGGASVSPACASGGFTYMGQPALGVSYSVRAENAANEVTQNYTEAFAKGTLGHVAENGDTGIDLGSRLGGLSGAWSKGLYAVDTTTALFSRAAIPDGPFDSWVLGITVADNDGNQSPMQGLDMNPTTGGSCVAAGNCTAKMLNPGGTRMRYGRLVLDPAHGSELLPLTLTLRTEYFNGTAWALNALDGCTTYASGNDSTKGAYHPACTDPTPSDGLACAAVTASGGGTVVGGVGSGLRLSPPGVTGTLNYGLTVQDWLKPDPSSTASFGIYRGNERVIYLREVWN